MSLSVKDESDTPRNIFNVTGIKKMFGAKFDYKTEDAKRLRILLITPCLHVADGVTVTLRKIYHHLKSLNGQMRILTSDSGREILKKNNDPLYEDCIFARNFHIHYDPTDSYAIVRMLTRSLKAEIQAFDPNVYHFTSPDPMAFSISEYTRKARKPLIATWHSNIPDYVDHTGYLQRVVIKPLLLYVFSTGYSYALATYVPQQAMKDKLEKQGYKNLHIWGRGVNTELFTPEKRIYRPEILKKYVKSGPDEGKEEDWKVIILWVSRCVKEKRHDIFIEVLRRLEEKYPGKVIGLVAGRGDRYEEMISLSNIYGIGWADRENLSKIYASSDILLFPSGVETFGNVTLEGMSSGLPVVGDEVCSSHLIEDGMTGYKCSQEGDLEAVYLNYFLKCEKLVLDFKLRKRIGREARNISVKKFQDSKIMDEMMAHYVEAMVLGEEGKVPKMVWNKHHRIARYINEALDKVGFTVMGPLAKFMFQWTAAGQLFIISGFFVIVAVLYALI